jgi:transposase InsO family protein
MTLILIVFGLLVLSLAARLLLTNPPHRARNRSRACASTAEPPPAPVHRFHRPKPPWVRQEVILLKALMSGAGCRRIAHTFNRLHQDRRDVTVGKTFVAGVLRDFQVEVLRLRREIKHRRPRGLARNVIWALDWTWVSGPEGSSTPVLGVLDHGSRACLELQPVENRRTVTLLRQLLDLFERFGTPRVLRTDNEPAVRSMLFRAVLRVLGIRHQRSDPFAPWQNGRIERLFLTVKEVIRQRSTRDGSNAVNAKDLHRIRSWYNHLRPHQHLDGRTPAEVWNRKDPDRRRPARWVSDWDGILAGCYRPE